MNPQCAKCLKVVYPMEKLSCLDKYWHKGCFKCTVCNMTLNMKNHKGYNKFPYCQAHYPMTKHTVVADTVENRRLTQLTKQQSQIEYTKDFNQEKGRYTVISDDPETRRNMQVSHNVSGIAYRNEHPPHHEVSVPASSSEMMKGNSSKLDLLTSKEFGPRGHDPRQAVAGRVAPAASRGRPPSTFIAMYDYTANDVDEVTILEGDTINNVHPIDDGWMEGRVQRTGKHGMFPANYVQPK